MEELKTSMTNRIRKKQYYRNLQSVNSEKNLQQEQREEREKKMKALKHEIVTL